MKPSQSANCLNDEDVNLFKFPQSSENVVSTSTGDSSVFVNCDSSDSRFIGDSGVTRKGLKGEDASDTVIVDILQEVSETAHTLESCANKYFTGCVVMKNIRRTNCDICKAELLSSTTVLSRNDQILIFFRAYQKKNTYSDFGRLIYSLFLLGYITTFIFLI